MLHCAIEFITVKHSFLYIFKTLNLKELPNHFNHNGLLKILLAVTKVDLKSNILCIKSVVRVTETIGSINRNQVFITVIAISSGYIQILKIYLSRRIQLYRNLNNKIK